ncbi:hypothetical protein VMHJH2_05380 [Streptococcus uberis]|uniref:hypothetical protein n=1 Tax=Streptococcus uberis TaxID=1349 RepID=UPI00215059FD|nr:hypothetical protein [Streptococcus uberis]MCR4257953.1 hypothetical protein [Streptococcus uberis]
MDKKTKNWYNPLTIIFIVTTLILYLMLIEKIKTQEKFLIDIWNLLTNETFISSLLGAGIAGGFSVYVLKKQSDQNEKMLEAQLKNSRDQFYTQNKLELEKLQFEHNLHDLQILKDTINEYLKTALEVQNNEIVKLYMIQKFIQDNNQVITEPSAVKIWKEIYEKLNSTISDIRFLQNLALSTYLTNSNYIKNELFSLFNENSIFIELDTKLSKFLEITREEIHEQNVSKFELSEYVRLRQLLKEVADALSNLAGKDIPNTIQRERKYLDNLLEESKNSTP